ncbi:arrestin homolog isoform X2 [Centruroides vittatus]|uniref:arrestin homolog isoform X2 n=1 Tax=Centruroides vittatus TaxID=120091 RepID=UPI0035105443
MTLSHTRHLTSFLNRIKENVDQLDKNLIQLSLVYEDIFYASFFHFNTMVVSFRVYKKCSPNGKIIIYLAKREYVDHINCVDPIDGVVVVHDDYLKERKVFGQVVATFRYGREDDEVMGLHFYKELYLCVEQIYPPPTDKEYTPTKIQEKLMKKLGPNAYPFYFQLPINAPQSVILQPGSEESGQPCGVYYDVKLFAGQSVEDKSHKRSTVRMGIKKIQWAPITQSRQPSTIVRKDFLLSPGDLELEVNLDRQVYFHGEQITVNISVRNYSNKTIKRIRVTAVQNIDICMFASGHCKEIIASVDTDKGCPILPGASIQKVVMLTPTTELRRRGVALDGQLKSDDVNLASSTLLSEQDQRDAFGIIVSYYVKVKLYLGALGGEVSAELPFILMQRCPSKTEVRTDSMDKDMEVAQFRSSRENTLDEEGSQGNPVFEDFGKTALIKS